MISQQAESWKEELVQKLLHGIDTPKGKTLSHRQKPPKETSGKMVMVNDNADEAVQM